jgi:hypothetical protein
MLCLLTDDNNKKHSHNTTTYCVYWRTITTTKPPWLRQHIVKHNVWSYYGWIYYCCPPSVNTICCRNQGGFVVVIVRPTTPIIIRPHMLTHGWQQRQIQPDYDHILCLLADDKNAKPTHNTTIYCVYWLTTTKTNLTIIRPHRICLCCHPSINIMYGRIMVGFIIVVLRQ